MPRSAFLASVAAAAMSSHPAIAREPASVAGASSSDIAVASGLSNFQKESISGFVAGASLSAVKTLVKFPLDTATVRLQMPNSSYSVQDLSRLFQGSYRGVTLSFLSNIPGGAVFFAVKDATKTGLKSVPAFSEAPRWVTTFLAVSAALLPYWAIRNPSEVLKVRQQVGLDGYGDGASPLDAVKSAIGESKNGTALDVAGEFYTGYWENILYTIPADVIKFVAYEAITDGRKDLPPAQGAAAGALATALAQLVTTPLDVVRNRLMTGKDQRGGDPISGEEKSMGKSLLRLAKEEGVGGFFAGATPRVAKAFLSGAIQFATYEETKQSIARILQQK